MEERLWNPYYVKTSVVPESACEPPGVKPNSEKHLVRVVAARNSEPGSAAPRRVDVYSAEGVKLDGQALRGTELLEKIEHALRKSCSPIHPAPQGMNRAEMNVRSLWEATGGRPTFTGCPSN